MVFFLLYHSCMLYWFEMQGAQRTANPLFCISRSARQRCVEGAFLMQFKLLRCMLTQDPMWNHTNRFILMIAPPHTQNQFILKSRSNQLIAQERISHSISKKHHFNWRKLWLGYRLWFIIFRSHVVNTERCVSVRRVSIHTQPLSAMPLWTF